MTPPVNLLCVSTIKDDPRIALRQLVVRLAYEYKIQFNLAAAFATEVR